MYYVYRHINPITNQVFYIGKGTGDRAYSRHGRSGPWKEFVNFIEQKGLTYSIEIVNICESEFEAFEHERILIIEAVSKGSVLFNAQLRNSEQDKILLVDEGTYVKKWDRDNTIASFVRTKRKRVKLTQKEFAEKSGVGLRFVREIESGKPTVRMDKVNQVLLMFGYELKPNPIDRKKLLS